MQAEVESDRASTKTKGGAGQAGSTHLRRALIAVAVAHVTQWPYYIQGHAKQAKRTGATNEELMEAIWAAADAEAQHDFLASECCSPRLAC